MVRDDLKENSDQLADAAQRLTAWREYVRAYPWICVGGALALGLLLAPSHSRASRKSPEDVTAPAVAGGTVLGLIAASVGRVAVSYAARAAMDLVSARGNRDPSEDATINEETT